MGRQAWYDKHPALKSVRKSYLVAQRRLQENLEKLYYKYNLRRSHRRIKAKLGSTSESYDLYLRDQLEETLQKKRLRGELRFNAIPLIDMLSSKYDIAGQSVLCVGCRNTDEITYFRTKGAARVVGIDLFSDNPDIVVMDMHDLKFSDGEFDVVYSRHSFEHAFDKHKAGHEFVRVLKEGGVVVIEVPGKYKGGADYNFFGDLNDVLDAFQPHVGEFLWKEYSRKEENTHKMDIIRLMFHTSKRQAV